MMCSLASAHDTFRDLQNNLKEGMKFYNNLTQVIFLLLYANILLNLFFGKVYDLAF